MRDQRYLRSRFFGDRLRGFVVSLFFSPRFSTICSTLQLTDLSLYHSRTQVPSRLPKLDLRDREFQLSFVLLETELSTLSLITSGPFDSQIRRDAWLRLPFRYSPLALVQRRCDHPPRQRHSTSLFLRSIDGRDCEFSTSSSFAFDSSI